MESTSNQPFIMIPAEMVQYIDELSLNALRLYLLLAKFRNRKTKKCIVSYETIKWERSKYYSARKELIKTKWVQFQGYAATWLRFIDSDSEFDTAEKSEFIYLVTDGQGNYKIGRTVNVTKRLSSINTSSPIEISLVSSYPHSAAEEEEKYLHNLFAAKQIRNEWFRLDSGDIAIFQSRTFSDSPNPKISESPIPQMPNANGRGNPYGDVGETPKYEPSPSYSCIEPEEKNQGECAQAREAPPSLPPAATRTHRAVHPAVEAEMEQCEDAVRAAFRTSLTGTAQQEQQVFQAACVIHQTVDAADAHRVLRAFLGDRPGAKLRFFAEDFSAWARIQRAQREGVAA